MRDSVFVLTSLVVASALGYLACGSPYPARRDAATDAASAQDDAAQDDAASGLDAAPNGDAAMATDAAMADDAPTSGA